MLADTPFRLLTIIWYQSEFEETILEDLRLLGVQGDQITHTSDYFDHLYDLALKLLKSGKAYADDTEQAQMREERMNGISSKHRNDSAEDNLKRFDEMKAGTKEGLRWCIRAKMSVDNPNKALRDPVIYRCNVAAHHRTGYVTIFWLLVLHMEFNYFAATSGKYTRHTISHAQWLTPSKASPTH